MILVWGSSEGDLSAQSFNLHYYTVSDGLPSNQVFGVMQFRIGELYIGTEYGLVQYDGEDFRQIPFEESKYSGSTVLGVTADPHKTLWVKTYRDGVFFLRNDTLRSFKGNHLLKEHIQASTIDQFAIDSTGNVWFTIGQVADSIFCIGPDGKKKPGYGVPVAVRKEGVKQFVFPVSSASNLIIRTSIGYRPKDHLKEINNKNGFGITLKDLGQLDPTRAGSFLEFDNFTFLSEGNLLIVRNRRNGTTKILFMPGEVHCLNIDAENNILIGTRNGALLYNILSGRLTSIFSGHQVHSICPDNEMGYWFATHNGLIYMPSLYIHRVAHPMLKGALSCIAGNDSILAVTAMDGQIHLLRMGSENLHYQGNYTRSLDMSIPKKTLIYGNKLIYGQVYFDIVRKQEAQLKLSSFGEMLDIEESEASGSLLVAYKRGFSRYHFVSPEKNLKEKTKCSDLFCRAVCEANGVIYLGTDHGVYRYTEKEGPAKYFPEQINYHINDIKATSGGKTLIISTRAAGVFIIEGEKVAQIDASKGLSSPYCTQIYVENDSTFWVGSNKGLNRIYWSSGRCNVDRWYSDDGLVSNKVNDLGRFGKYLFVLTDQGICYFEPENLNVSKSSVLLEIKEIRVQGERVKDGFIKLKPNSRDVLFVFKILGFKKGKNVQLSYLLTGKDQLLSQTGGRTIMYRDLVPDRYTLEVKALGFGDKQLGETLLFTIEVEPHFYETRFFWIFCSVLFLFLVLISFYLYFKRVEAVRKRKWEYGNAQLEALNLQINPHFLFNALNSIQYLSLTQEHKVLNRFISGLSDLLRSILRNSKNNLIPLSLELENIKRYLALEVVRFEDEDFEYELIVHEGLEASAMLIPPMLIQPVVENAIWHGLLPVKGRKRLSIEIKNENMGFSVTVEDNGTGIIKSMEARKNLPEELKSSLGLDNVKRRLHLYQSMGFGEAEIKITDLGEHAPGHSGTRVTLLFRLSQENKKP